MTRKFLIPIAAVLVAIPLTFAACGDDDDETTAAADQEPIEATGEETTTEDSGGGGGGGGETIAISETEFALDPSDPTSAAGTVTIDVTNDGATVHNLGVKGNGVDDISSDLNPGDSDTLELDLEAGTYNLYCGIGDHAAQGMTGELTVE